MLPVKNRTLKQYTWGTFKSLLTSQFIYSTPNNILQLKRLSLTIHTRKQKKIHYLYLWLLTKKIPYLQKFYPSWKNNSKNNVLRTKPKNHSLIVTVAPKNIFNLLHESLLEIISKEIISDKKVWTFKKHFVNVMIFSVPLTKKTYLLQMKNTYFPTFAMGFKFRFSNTTAFQKIFFLRALKVLSSTAKIPALDSL